MNPNAYAYRKILQSTKRYFIAENLKSKIIAVVGSKDIAYQAIDAVNIEMGGMKSYLEILHIIHRRVTEGWLPGEEEQRT
jgi:hypothetical protein